MSSLETFELQSAEVDTTLAEMADFNTLVEQIDSIPAYIKEALSYENSAMKLGGPADSSNGYGKD